MTSKKKEDDQTIFILAIALISMFAGALFGYGMVDKNVFCDSRVASAISNTHPSNATLVIFPKDMQMCIPAFNDQALGYNCVNATENMTVVIEVYK